MKLPDGFEFLGKAVFHDTEDCMANPQQFYSRTVKSDSGLLIGYGPSSDEATNNVIKQAVVKSQFNALPDVDRLKKMLIDAKDRGRFYNDELIEVISILAKNI